MRRTLITGMGVMTTSGLLATPVLAQEESSPMELELLSMLPQLIRWDGLVASLVVIATAWLFLRFLGNLVRRLCEIFVERRLLFQRLSAITHFVVYMATIVSVILLGFEISSEMLVLLGGGAAVAVGFAMKDLVASLVAGVTIMFDRPFQLGDRVSFGGQYGDVVAIGLRSVKLQTLDDSTVTIPNNLFLTDITSSGNYGILHMQIVVDFYIGVDQDVQLARDLVREVTVISRYVYLPKPVVVRVSQVIVQSYVAVRLRLKVYVLDTQYEKALETDVTLRVLEAFAESGIKPPAVLHQYVGDPGPTDHNGLRLAS
jgi:small-conductance mechanosensitive channel